MKVGDLVRVPKYSYVASYVGIITKINEAGGMQVVSLDGEQSHWIYECGNYTGGVKIKLELLA